MKKCSKCNIEKELTEFWIRKNRKNNRSSECKTCASLRRRSKDKNEINKKRKEYYKNNKEKIKKYNSEYQKRNKEKVNTFHRIWWKNNGDTYSEKRKEKRKNYTEEQKEKIREYARKNRKIYIEKNFEKEKARRIINYFVQRKYVEKPKECSKCFKESKIEAHHPDYSKPWDVIWVCRECHLAIHKELKQG